MQRTVKKIGLITSGGDSSGMNACIRAIVRTACAEGIEIVGFYRGYEGIMDNDYVAMTTEKVANIIHRGGTILKTARSKRLAHKAITKLPALPASRRNGKIEPFAVIDLVLLFAWLEILDRGDSQFHCSRLSLWRQSAVVIPAEHAWNRKTTNRPS